jgi:hypothetical protein
MTYIIFEVKSEDAGKINKLIKDDLISRQSILIRDSRSLDIKGDLSFIKIEGSDQGIKQAESLAKELGFKKLKDKDAKEVDKKIEEQESSAASGIGMIFD